MKRIFISINIYEYIYERGIGDKTHETLGGEVAKAEIAEDDLRGVEEVKCTAIVAAEE